MWNNSFVEVFYLICVQNKDYSISLRSDQGYEEHNGRVLLETIISLQLSAITRSGWYIIDHLI